MIDKGTYTALVQKIVAEVAPDEQVSFDLSVDGLADQLYRTGTITNAGSTSDEFQFIEAASQILTFVALMVGTFEAMRKLYKSLRGADKKTELIAAKWLVELKVAGLPEATAVQIVSKFQPELEHALGQSDGG